MKKFLFTLTVITIFLVCAPAAVLAADITLNDGDVVTISANNIYTLPAGYTATLIGDAGTVYNDVGIICEANSSITLRDVRIDRSATIYALALYFSSYYGNNTLTIEGTNTVKAGAYYSGVSSRAGINLTIGGTGTLEAESAGAAPGIGFGAGNGWDINSGRLGIITIESGTIIATGSTSSPGIGVSSNRGGGQINITGGTVYAYGGAMSPGIGNGRFCSTTVPPISVNISGDAKIFAQKSDPYNYGGFSDIGDSYDTPPAYSTALTITGTDAAVFTKSDVEYTGTLTLQNGAAWSADSSAISSRLSDLGLSGSPWNTAVGAYFTPNITGTASISGNAYVGEVLTATLSASNSSSPIYQWQVSDDSISWSDISLAASQTYTIASAQAGKYIRVEISGSDVVGEIYSSSVGAVINQPSAPQSLSAAEGVSEVTLSWSAPSDDGGSAVTGYEVSSDNGTSWAAASSPSDHTFTGLTNGVEYFFRVRAVNIAGEGAQASTSATPRTVPDAPENLTGTSGDSEVALSWSAPSFDGGSAITSYQVSNDGGTTWITSSSSTGHTFTGLTNGTQYIFCVRAINVAGDGAQASIAATPSTVPNVPENIVTVAGDGQIIIEWQPPLYDGGSVITGYEVSCDDGANWTAASAINGHTFTGLTNGVEYICKVRAVNASGSGVESAGIAEKPYETRMQSASVSANTNNNNNTVITIQGSDLIIDQIVSFYINGVEITLDRTNPTRYTFSGGYLEQGSIVVTMEPAFVNTLPLGINYFIVEMNNGGLYVVEAFTVSNARASNSQTGDDSARYLWTVLIAAATILAACWALFRKKLLKNS
ncbi:MAG: fibronectin type III domain-containing protein [Eubacteriales bacterium]